MSKPGTSPLRTWHRTAPGHYVYLFGDARAMGANFRAEVEGLDRRGWEWYAYCMQTSVRVVRVKGSKTRQQAQRAAELAIAELLKPYAMEYLAITGSMPTEETTEDAEK